MKARRDYWVDTENENRRKDLITYETDPRIMF